MAYLSSQLLWKLRPGGSQFQISLDKKILVSTEKAGHGGTYLSSQLLQEAKIGGSWSV
jgi:hypothetical protein